MALEGDDAVQSEAVLGVLIDIRKLLRKLVILQEEGMNFEVTDEDVEG